MKNTNIYNTFPVQKPQTSLLSSCILFIQNDRFNFVASVKKKSTLMFLFAFLKERKKKPLT